MDKSAADEWIANESVNLGSRVGMGNAQAEGKSFDIKFIENCLERSDLQHMEGKELLNICSKDWNT